MEPLRIRSVQMDRLNMQMRSDFIAKVAAYLREAFPLDTTPLNDRSLAARINTDADRAFGYGIQTERDVCHFVDFSFRYGSHFDRGPVREILEREDLEPAERLHEAGHMLRNPTP